MKTYLLLIVALLTNLFCISVNREINNFYNLVLYFGYIDLSEVIDYEYDGSIRVYLSETRTKKAIYNYFSEINLNNYTVETKRNKSCLKIKVSFEIITKEHNLCLKENKGGTTSE